MTKLISEKPRYGVRLELGDDGVYCVQVDGSTTFQSRVRSAADIEFNDAVAARSEVTRDARARELADSAVRGVLAAAGRQKSAARQAGRSRGKGG